VVLKNDLKHESEAKNYWKKKALARSVKEEQLEWELQERKEVGNKLADEKDELEDKIEELEKKIKDLKRQLNWNYHHRASSRSPRTPVEAPWHVAHRAANRALAEWREQVEREEAVARCREAAERYQDLHCLCGECPPCEEGCVLCGSSPSRKPTNRGLFDSSDEESSA
jgi:phage shock protein A